MSLFNKKSLRKNEKMEKQKPAERQDYGHERNMYKIESEKGYNLLVSPEHKVYANDREDYINLRSLLSPSVLNALTLSCRLNAGSLDQIAQSNFNASANIGTSLSCINCLALDSSSLDNPSGIISINSFNFLNIESTCSNGSSEYLEIEDLIFSNSFQQCSGEYNSKFKDCELIRINLTGFSLKNESNIFVSTTNFIHHPSFFNFSQAFCFTSLPSLMQSSSLSSEFSNILSNFLSSNALLTFSDKNLRIDSEMFSSGSSSSCFFNSSGMDKVMFGIFAPPLNSVYSVENVQIFKPFCSNHKKELSDFELITTTEDYNPHSAEIDILVTVPAGEGAVTKSSQLVFTGWYVRET